MQRRHFEALASALKSRKPNQDRFDIIADYEVAAIQWEGDVRAICSAVREFNPNFDTDRFYRACGA